MIGVWGEMGRGVGCGCGVWGLRCGVCDVGCASGVGVAAGTLRRAAGRGSGGARAPHYPTPRRSRVGRSELGGSTGRRTSA